MNEVCRGLKKQKNQRKIIGIRKNMIEKGSKMEVDKEGIMISKVKKNERQ